VAPHPTASIARNAVNTFIRSLLLTTIIIAAMIGTVVRDLLGIVPGSKADFRRAPDGSIELVHAAKKQQPSRWQRAGY